jgi:ribosomal protein S2
MVKCRKLENPQEELLLLRNCTGAPKVIYWPIPANDDSETGVELIADILAQAARSSCRPELN